MQCDARCGLASTPTQVLCKCLMDPWAIAMQGLVPFQVAYQKAKQDTSDGESVKVLDVASGTGRFLSFL